jgi:hypothetical protein
MSKPRKRKMPKTKKKLRKRQRRKKRSQARKIYEVSTNSYCKSKFWVKRAKIISKI